MGKQFAHTLHIVTAVIVTVVALALTAVLASWQPGRAAAPAAPVHAETLASATWSSHGAVVTQTFALHGGWNTIYLEVEPLNPAPLVDPYGDGPLLPTHALSSMEAIFAQLDACACLEPAPGDEGCGCRNPAPDPSLAALLLFIPLARRRRRR